MANALTEAAAPSGTITGRTPGKRERLANALQDLIERAGVDRYTARKWAQSVIGGGSSNLPINTGLVDATGLGGLLDYADNPQSPAMFIGPLSKTWNKAAATQAETLEKAGKDARAIWKETGTFRGADGKWRQEIDDSGALFNPSTVGGKVQENAVMVGMGDLDMGPAVGGLMKHPQLQAAYGADIAPSSFVGNKNTMLGDGVQGGFDPITNSLTINAPALPQQARSTMLHELQHAIQTKQGWASGGNANMAFRDPRIYGMGAYGTDEARRMLAERLKDISTPTPLDEYARVAWGTNEITPEIRAAHVDYVKSLKKTVTPEIVLDVQRTVAQDWYRRLAGEAEARATQSRMNLNAQQRRELFPFDSYDVPLDQLIVRR